MKLNLIYYVRTDSTVSFSIKSIEIFLFKKKTKLNQTIYNNEWIRLKFRFTQLDWDVPDPSFSTDFR